MVQGSSSEVRSLHRRLRFASWSQVCISRIFYRIGLSALALRLGRTPYSVANILYDLTEWVRNGFRLNNPGQVHIAALEAPIRLPQIPKHRGYWHDPQRNALVGMHLGLDLVRNQGKYYLIEANLGAALRPERRSLYCSELDPLISEFLALAKQNNFKRIVLYRSGWSEEYRKEFELAQRHSGIEVIGASSPINDPRAPHPMTGLPEQLQKNTIYVIFSGQNSPLSVFIHDKLWVGSWLQETIDAHRPETNLLRYIPTYENLILPAEPQDPKWPNLVIKLASGDQAKFVLIGRFRSEAHAREELGLHNPDGIPGAFHLSLKDKMLDRLFPRLQAIYQPYIPPEVVDGAPRKVRLHVFISPLINQFLSAHYIYTYQQIEEVLPEGLIKGPSAYIVSFSSLGGHFEKLENTTESELRTVTDEYGRIANLAVRNKFEITPS